MKKVISLILTLCLVMSVVAIAPVVSVQAASATENLNWQRIKTISFTQAEETAGVFKFSDSTGAVAEENIKDELVEVTFPTATNGGGIRIEKRKTIAAGTLILSVPDISGTTGNIVKVGVRYKSNSTGDIFRFETQKSSGVLNTIYVNGPSLRYGYRGSYGNKIYDHSFASVTEDVKDAAFIFDISAGTYTPVFDGKELCAPYARKSDMARPTANRFVLNLPYTADGDGTYVQILELYVEEGFDAGAELTEELILGENESSSAVTKNLYLPEYINESDAGKKASVTYTSSKPAVIANDGTVTQGALDESVTITAEINYNGQLLKKEFTFTVPKESLPYDTNWKKVMSVTFTEEEEAAGNYVISAGEENVSDLLNIERAAAADGGGLIITKKTDSATVPILTIEDPTEILTNSTAQIVKVGARYKFNSTGDGFRFRIYRPTGYLASIFATASKFRWGYTSSYGNKIHEVEFPDGTSGIEFDTAMIIDLENGTMIPVLDSEELCDPFKSSYAVRPDYAGFELNFPYADGNYVQLMEFYVEEGFYAGKDLVASALLGDNEADNEITEDLQLVTVLNEGTLEEATVTYESSNPSVIDENGIVTRGEVTEVVYLTAEINYQGQLSYKRFKFVVLADGIEEKYLSIEDEDFTYSPLGYEFVQDGGKASYINGHLSLARGDGAGNLSAEKYFVSGLKGNPFIINGEEILFETFINMSNHLEKGKLTLRDEENNELSSVSVSNGESGYTLKYTSANGESDGIAVNGGKDIFIRYLFNTADDTFKLYVDNKEVDSTVNKETVSGGSVSSVIFEAPEGTEGSLLIDSIKLLYRTDNKDKTAVELDCENLKLSDLTSQKSDSISEDLKYLSQRPFGSNVEYVVLTETNAIAADGSVTRLETDQPVSLKVVLTKGTETAEKPFDFIVKGANHKDIALNALTYSSVSENGFGAANAVDYLFDTAWITSSNDAYLTVCLPESEKFNKVILSEAKIADNFPITGFEVYVSDNNRTWTQVSAGTSVGESKTIFFDITENKYIKFAVTSKDSTKVGLYEFELYYEPEANDAVLEDKDSVTLPEEYIIESNLTLIKNCTYGSTVEWISSHPSILSNEGIILDVPAEDTVITLTAVISKDGASYTKIFKRMIEGDGNYGSGGSGGAGGGAGGSGGGGGGGTKPVDKSPVDSVEDGGEATKVPETPSIPVIKFEDVSFDRWSYEFINELAAAGIISGDGTGNFRPTDRVSREEYLKMLVSALELKTEETANIGFEDVSDGAWYKEYVQTALQLGIVNGVSADRFGVGAPITRQDMAVMTLRALTAAEITLEGDMSVQFADVDEISIYAAEGVNALVSAGIINGSDGKFLPNDNLTREQAAKIIALVRRVAK